MINHFFVGNNTETIVFLANKLTVPLRNITSHWITQYCCSRLIINSDIDTGLLAGDGPGAEEVGVQVLSSSQYCRFRAVSKRLDTCGEKWLRNSLVVALGGFATRTRCADWS